MRISDWSSDVCSSDLSILRLVEFLVGNARLALNSLKVCNLVRLARDFDRRRRGILRRHQQGRDQSDQKTYRDRAEDHIAPANDDTQILAQYRRPAIFRRSEEHTSELQSPKRTSYAVLCLQ